MEILPIRKQGNTRVSFNKGKKFLYKPIRLADATTEESTKGLKRRKMGNLKLQTTFSFKLYLLLESDNSGSKEEGEDFPDKQNPPELMFSTFDEQEVAATKLQKVYKSYRTRRILADCAVLCEELWWKASDSNAFKRCFASHFDSDKSETTSSNWARARTMAAKVGKGLSKDVKAKTLALRHWLEAIDPRHRYGHNLHFYYDVWFQSQSSQPFFYWLDVGEGKEENLETLPRKQLQMQCIKYLGPEEREAYEVIVEGGKLVYRQSKEPVHTTDRSKWIFVLSPSRILYVGQKMKGQFQHSSFLAGGATIASGRLVAHDGVLNVVWPYSGHYRPTKKNFGDFILFLEKHDVDMTHVETHPVDDDIPPCYPVDEELLFDHIEGNVGSSDTATANNHGQENVGHFGTDVEENKPVSLKWDTGVGPRIGCMNEYPSKLKLRALEHLSLVVLTEEEQRSLLGLTKEEQLSLSPRVNHGTFAGKTPIPSPRPSAKVHLSPRLANLGRSSPRVHVSPL